MSFLFVLPIVLSKYPGLFLLLQLLHMIPMQQESDSFPSTIVKGEHQTCSSGNSDSNNAVNSTLCSLKEVLHQSHKEVLSSGQSSSQEPTKFPALSSRSTTPGSDKKSSNKALSVDECPCPSDIVDLLSPPHSPEKESAVLSVAKKPYSNLRSSAESSPSSSIRSSSESSLQSDASSKRKNREEGNCYNKFGHIPKRVKSNDSNIAPTLCRQNQGYGIKSTLSFDLLLGRFESWKKFLGYKPSKNVYHLLPIWLL